jgi:S1-C subfamily serine protease
MADWKIPIAHQPKAEECGFDLERTLMSVLSLSATVPADAFSADTLGTERAGNGVLIEGGLVLTIGYLITEADSIWLRANNGQTFPGHPVGYDYESGFGLVQPLARLDLPELKLGRSSEAEVGRRVVVAGAGGRARSVSARVVARQEFAGYWEYLIPDAIFTAPAHPNWGGTAVLGPEGELLGIGSLQLEQGSSQEINMSLPIDLLRPVFDDLVTLGRPNRPPRPWLGLYTAETDGRLMVVGVSDRGPASDLLKEGDAILEVAGERVSDLGDFYRGIWALGQAGASVPLKILRDGRKIDLRVVSADRGKLLKAPKLH